MPRNLQEVGACPKCQVGTVVCLHNRFENDLHRIDSWEHKCPNCGQRETEAFRKLPTDPEPERDPLVCPFCSRKVTLA
jgi:ssDNA-binding Zn-finger/Zn-ribbon topoisomerase 1